MRVIIGDIYITELTSFYGLYPSSNTGVLKRFRLHTTK